MLLAFWSVYTLFSHLPPYLVQAFASTTADIGMYCALLSVPLIIAGLLTSALSHMLGIKNITALSLLLIASGLLWLTNAKSIAGLILPGSMVAFGIVFIEVTSAQLVARLATPQDKGDDGHLRSVVMIAEVVATLVAGYLAGVDVVTPFIVASMMVIFALFFLRQLPREEQDLTCEGNKSYG